MCLPYLKVINFELMLLILVNCNYIHSINYILVYECLQVLEECAWSGLQQDSKLQ